MHPRLITENACVAITRRTTLRKAFLFPWAGAGHALESGAAAVWSRGGSTNTSASSVADGERPRWDQVGQIFAYAAGLAQRGLALTATEGGASFQGSGTLAPEERPRLEVLLR